MVSLLSGTLKNLQCYRQHSYVRALRICQCRRRTLGVRAPSERLQPLDVLPEVEMLRRGVERCLAEHLPRPPHLISHFWHHCSVLWYN